MMETTSVLTRTKWILDPTVSAAPNPTVIMVAEKIADQIKASLKMI